MAQLDEKTHFVVYLKFVIGETLKLYQELFHFFGVTHAVTT